MCMLVYQMKIIEPYHYCFQNFCCHFNRIIIIIFCAYLILREYLTYLPIDENDLLLIQAIIILWLTNCGLAITRIIHLVKLKCTIKITKNRREVEYQNIISKVISH